MKQLLKWIITPGVLLLWHVKSSAVKKADWPVSWTLSSRRVLFFLLSCCSALKRLVKLLCHDNCSGSDGGKKSRKAAPNCCSHARHTVSDAGEGRTQTQTPDLRGSWCQTLLEQHWGKGDNVYPVTLTDVDIAEADDAAQPRSNNI